MDCTEILNLIAIIVIPIAAVIIGQSLQDRSEKRKDKMEIFKTLIYARIYGWTTDSVKAMNLIEIVFSDDKDVCNRWKAYYKEMCIQSTEQSHLENMGAKQNELIQAMGRALGYNDDFTLEVLQHPYMPEGMSAQIARQRNDQETYSQALDLISKMMSQQGKTSAYGQQRQDAKTNESGMVDSVTDHSNLNTDPE